MGYVKPITCICRNLYPWLWVWVSMGMGAGSPGKPQGCLWHSLIMQNSPGSFIITIQDKHGNNGGRCAFSHIQEGIKNEQLEIFPLSFEKASYIIHWYNSSIKDIASLVEAGSDNLERNLLSISVCSPPWSSRAGSSTSLPLQHK